MPTISILVILCLLTDLYVPISGCDLKASNKIFHDSSGIPWPCRDYCPSIRGCLEQCCPPKVPPQAPEPPGPAPPGSAPPGPERNKIWPVAFPCVLAGCLLIAVVWKLLKNRKNNSGQDVEALGGAEDTEHLEENLNHRNQDVEVQGRPADGLDPQENFYYWNQDVEVQEGAPAPEDEEEIQEGAVAPEDEGEHLTGS